MTSITVSCDINRLSPNGRLHWREKASRVKAARTRAYFAWKAADSPRFTTPVTVAIHVQRGRVIDADNALACCKPLIDGIFGGNATPDDSAQWVEFLPITFETGDKFRRRETVTFTIQPRPAK